MFSRGKYGLSAPGVISARCADVLFKGLGSGPSVNGDGSGR